MRTLRGKNCQILHSTHPENLPQLLLSLRNSEGGAVMSDIVHDPLLLPDIQVALSRLAHARTHGERVMIFGDYDVDGISSTATLFLFLRDELGMNVSYRLPHRVNDGYGIKLYHIDEIARTGTTLIVTVDCGTKDIEPIEHAKKLNIDVIVTDHHSCPSILPDCVAVINPRRKDSQYPFSSLSGSGVVWKLIHALSDFFSPEKTSDLLQKYVDIVSLGTVADCMPMLDENRTIVRRGILQSQKSSHSFFKTFSNTLRRPILTEEDIGFFIGPLLNAGGRLTSPQQSLSTLLAEDDSFDRVQELIALNEVRKEKSRRAFEKAVTSVDMSSPILIYIDEKLEHGILGLVAARLTELFHKPSAVFTLHEGSYVGSLRAPVGMDLVSILEASGGNLDRFGGHAGAAGCSIQSSKMTTAMSDIISATHRLYADYDTTPAVLIDSVLDSEKIDIDTISQIEKLRPFGMGFTPPIFLLENISAPVMPLGTSGEHIRWSHPGPLEILGFRFGEYRDVLHLQNVGLIGTLKSRTWNGVTSPQFHVIDAVLGV